MKNFEADTINETQAIEHLKIFYPSIQNEISQLSAQNNFPGIIQSTVDYLKVLLKESKINIVNRNIKMMEWIYKNGTFNVKHIIENLFIRSFGSLKNILTASNGTFCISICLSNFNRFILTRRDWMRLCLRRIKFCNRLRPSF
ncbi:hypothetical protein [Chryseobacterium sp. 3008163]|uniref:DUF7674 family protein n=1 Tax=Chryseobacterium sp. 3008163 TaxID=2478663 RepID=UPI001E5B6ABE|nr:hypothetical protein [Chryseobacterium sp. 3008163]